MKKQRKPLQLRTETVRSLSTTQLSSAAGGLIKTNADSACSTTDAADCYTAYCTSNICQTSFCAGTLHC